MRSSRRVKGLPAPPRAGRRAGPPAALLWLLLGSLAGPTACSTRTAVPLTVASPVPLPIPLPIPSPVPLPRSLPPPLRLPQPSAGGLLLLGEVHDNADGHAQRLALLQRWIDQGARPALLMEQFDRELQPAIDRLLADPVAPGDALALHARTEALVALTLTPGTPGTPAGWDWSLYRPVLRLALHNRLRLVAANVSRGDARAVIQQGLAARGFEAAVPPDIAQAQAQEIERSHCGAIDAPMARRMATAQVARDQFMAQQLQAQGADGAVLLAGNGHVRRDVGVPRWLQPAQRARAQVIGFVEPDNAEPGAFDQAIEVPAQSRADPCGAMRQR